MCLSLSCLSCLLTFCPMWYHQKLAIIIWCFLFPSVFLVPYTMTDTEQQPQFMSLAWLNKDVSSLTMHPRPPASPQVVLLWIRLDAASWICIAELGFWWILASSCHWLRGPLCKSSLPSYTQLPCIKVKGMLVPTACMGRTSANAPCMRRKWWSSTFSGMPLMYYEEHFRIIVTEIQYIKKRDFI